MSIDEAEDELVAMGLPEETAMEVLEVLNLYGVYEVRVKPEADKEKYFRVRCFTQHDYDVDLLEVG